MNLENKKEVELYYVEIKDVFKIKGSVTGNEYIFRNGPKKLPLPTLVDERDLVEFLERRKQKCNCSKPRRVFFTADEIAKALAGEIDLMKL